MLEQQIKSLEEVLTKHMRRANETMYREELLWHRNYIAGIELVLIAAGYQVTYNDNIAHIEKF